MLDRKTGAKNYQDFPILRGKAVCSDGVGVISRMTDNTLIEKILIRLGNDCI